jgi:N-acetylglucosamine kinase-like BadF-type ATPase/ribosomal protein S18 acetylase RimI-like enzyme
VTGSVVVAVDGGNSKTDVVLLDTRGSLMAVVRGPGSSPHMLGLEVSMHLVDNLISRACGDAGIRADGRRIAEFGAWFMAGADLPAEERALRRAIDQLGRTSRNSVANDTFAVLRAGTDDGWGVAVVVGAGINCVGCSPAGRRARFLSLGNVTGDWGGGSDIGMAALGAAVRSEDGRAKPSTLTGMVADHFQKRRATDVAIALHQHQFHMNRLRELAPHVVAAAEADDPAAVEILNRQADEVVTWVVGAIRRLRIARLDVPVVLGGSVLAALPHRFVDRMRAGVHRVAPSAHCTVCRERPIVGAALAALDLAGADRGATRKARAQLNNATFEMTTAASPRRIRPSLIVEPARLEDVARLVELEGLLFAEDAGQHDRFADVNWPQRQGRGDFERLIADRACTVLVARDGSEIVGHLVGYTSRSSPTRQPVTYATLRSMYVISDHRREGVGRLMAEHFITWARNNKCVEVHVDSYVANEPAQRFYERLGFIKQSMSHVLTL